MFWLVVGLVGAHHIIALVINEVSDSMHRSERGRHGRLHSA
jgi:hypothetical protein